MLKIINLFIIDKIFNKVANCKLSPKAQMLYINCLTHHFKHLEAKQYNCNAFDFMVYEFPNYDKYVTLLKELDNASLIELSNGRILFYNVWSSFINKSLLDNPTQEIVQKSVIEFKEELLLSEQLIELSAMKYKLSKGQVAKLIEFFVKEQEAFKKHYLTYTDCIKHLTYWMGTNHHKIPKEIVKSNNKMLGKE
jgi:hypothetical protein